MRKLLSIILSLVLVSSAQAVDLRKNGQTSNIIRMKLVNSSAGAGLTGLTSASSGLIISTIASNESTATVYAAGSSNIETITTLGTFAAPTSGKCRFKEVDATNHPGLYEFQFADARFAVSNARTLVITVSGATSLLSADYLVELTGIDVQNATTGGIAHLDADVSSRSSPGTAQAITFTQGEADLVWNSATRSLTDKAGFSLAVTPPTAAQIVTALLTELTSNADFNTANSLGKMLKDALTGNVPQTADSNLTLTDATNGLAAIRSKLNLVGNDAASAAGSASDADAGVGNVLTLLGTPAGASISADIATANTNILTRLSTAGYTTPPTVTQIRAEMDANSTKLPAIKTVTDKLDSAFEQHGLVYRFTTDALSNAPAGGGGGGALTTEQDDRLKEIEKRVKSR